MIIQSGFDFVDLNTKSTYLYSPFVCLQTYIFTDGEDEELKKKIGKFYEGNFIIFKGTEIHIVLLERELWINEQSYFDKNSALSFFREKC